MDDVGYQARFLRWDIVSSRTGSPLADRLKPTDAQRRLPRQSLSATYGGVGTSPFTPMAPIHVRPPDVVLLSVDGPSDVPTLLWKFRTGRVPVEQWHDLRHGLFTVRSGQDASLLAPAFEGSRVRFDPGCMDPSDLRARRVSAFFEAVRENAVRHDWTESGKVLAIDNRTVLHARASAEGEPKRVMHRVTLRLGKDPK